MLVVPLALTNFGRLYLFIATSDWLLGMTTIGGEHACLKLPLLGETNFVLFEGISFLLFCIFECLYSSIYERDFFFLFPPVVCHSVDFFGGFCYVL